MTNEITNNEMALLKGYAVAAADKSQPPEAQGMRLTNFRWHANPGIILALIAKVESLAADAERLHFEMHEATNSLVARLAAPAVANDENADDLPPLPDAVMHTSIPYYDGRDRLYSADQMHAYARAAIAATAPNTAGMLKWEPLTKAGQVKKGDYVRFDLCGESKTHQVALMLNPGTDKEEIIYHRRNNWYLITSMSVKGEGSQKNVEILPVSAFVAAHAGQGAKA